MTQTAHLHLIGNAHLDPAWMWEWGEGMEAFIATCRSALERMEENERVVFTCSSAAHYRWVERAEPEMFEAIRRRVAEGRWEIVGGWWTQTDCNLPSGEGFLRQAELGQRYFVEKFGRPATIGYSPDAFGHCAGLPQLLRAGGLHSYLFCRPDPTELALPSPLFRWHSPDGSAVTAYRVPFHYNMYQTTVRKKVEDLRRALDGPSDLVESGDHLSAHGSEWALLYGIGNHGGGPTREQIATIEEIAREGEVDISFSRLDAFLDDRERALPEWRDDLQMNAPGCYTVGAAIKILNRRAEHELLRAEIVETMAAAANGTLDTPPSDEPGFSLRHAWENVCFNHFHDILCGVAIPEALDNATHLYGESLAIADRVTRHALRSIVRRIDTRGDGMTLVVLNPHSFPIDRDVTFELWHDIDKDLWSQPVDLSMTDDEGEEIPVQQVRPSGKIGRDRIAASFRAAVPPFGWRCWRVRYGRKSAYDGTHGLIEARDTVLENEHLRVELDPDGGGIARLLHKESGLDLLDGVAAMPVVIDDPTDTWGHGVTRFNDVIGRFDRGTVRLVADGPTHATVRIESRWGRSTWHQEITLHAGSNLLHVAARFTQGEPRTMIKLLFPTRLAKARTVVEAAYATIEKEPDGTERPGGAWKAIVGEIDGTRCGIGIADTLTHGYSADGGTLALSLLRSPSYATHDPHVIEADEDVRFCDMGETAFRYTVRVFVEEGSGEKGVGSAKRGGGNGEQGTGKGGGCRTAMDRDEGKGERGTGKGEPSGFRAAMYRDAAVVNAPMVLSLESGHGTPSGRPLPRSSHGIEISHRSIIATAMMRDASGAALRLFETSGDGGEGAVRLSMIGAEWDLSVRPHELLTVRTSPSPSSTEG